VSRLEFAPKLDEIKVTDIEKGIGVFIPKPDKAVSFALLENALKKAGYSLDTSDVTVVGTLAHDEAGWWLVATPTGQRFALVGPTLERLLNGMKAGASVEVTGDWKTLGAGKDAHEIIAPREVKGTESVFGKGKATSRNRTTTGGTIEGAHFVNTVESTRFASAIFSSSEGDMASSARGFIVRTNLSPHIDDAVLYLEPEERGNREDDSHPRDSHFVDSNNVAASRSSALAPIRTTSPGLTVYMGGAIVPRLSFISQDLGELHVHRQALQLSASYTPTPHLQLEAEIPFSRTSFNDGATSGAGSGWGNPTLWGKYRFFRRVQTWGDRQAAVRFGLELPLGDNDTPNATQLRATPFVRQQLSAINGGFTAHLDAAYSQARRRLIFGGNIEGVLRSNREGFRLGHELRLNTDLEYVVFPVKYRRPTGELFAILETSYVVRGRGRIEDTEVGGSSSNEYFIAPGLQYVATTRMVFETSWQFPVFRRTGAEVLRTNRNVLFGIKYLF
jgi:hypothetical protein